MKKNPPDQPAVAALVDALEAIAHGERPDQNPEDLFLAALAAVSQHDPYELDGGDNPDLLVGRRLAELREMVEWTQAEMAEALNPVLHMRANAKTTAQTVVDIERGRRRLSLSELYGVAALFGVPLVELILPRPDEPIDTRPGGLIDTPEEQAEYDALPHVALSSRQARELVLGRGGRVGRGGPLWAPAAMALHPPQERPAGAYWQARRATERGDE